MTTTSTRPTTRTGRAPYQVGDHVSAAYLDAKYGTVLIRNAPVLEVQHTDEQAAYPWTITYRIDNEPTRVRVNAAGTDINRNVEPSTSVLTIDEAHTPAGRTAITLADALRRVGVPGPLATTTGGNNMAVVLTWPSGNDRVVIGVEVWDGEPVFDVAAYEDREHTTPAHEHTAHTVPDVVTEVARLLATYAANTADQEEPPPWAVSDGTTVTVHHPDGTTTTATVAALVDRDDVAGTSHVEVLTNDPDTDAVTLVRHTRDAGDGTTRTNIYAEPHAPQPEPGVWRWAASRQGRRTITGHEPMTGEPRPIPLRDIRRRDYCRKCGRVHGGDRALAVGLFSGLRGYRASTAPNAPLRPTREQAEADECAWSVSRSTR